jgi:hypothetical protein
MISMDMSPLFIDDINEYVTPLLISSIKRGDISIDIIYKEGDISIDIIYKEG